MKRIIVTEKAPAPVGPYSQAVQLGDTLYISGQIAIDPATGALVKGTIEEETHRVMQNIHAVLLQAGSGFQHVLKCTVFVKDMNLYSRINEIYGQYFDHATAPARELVEVSNLPKFVNIEISTIAFVP